MSVYRTLEEVLVGERLLPQDELERAVRERNGFRGGLGWYLVERGLLTDQELARAFAQLYALPLVDLGSTPVEAGVLDLFPLERMRRDLFLPLRRIPSLLE